VFDQFEYRAALTAAIHRAHWPRHTTRLDKPVNAAPPTEAPVPDLRNRTTFRNWTRIAIRYADLDPIGHVNNTAMPMFFEEARCSLIYPVLQANGRQDLDLVLVRTIIEYVKELAYPGAVDIGSSVHRVGTKSLHMVHGVFDATTGACAGTGECTLVIFNQQSRTSVAAPDELRQRLLGLG
jgi:acyl-CoA thioester hydrolase